MSTYIDQQGRPLIVERGLNDEYLIIRPSYGVDSIIATFDHWWAFEQSLGPNTEHGIVIHIG